MSAKTLISIALLLTLLSAIAFVAIEITHMTPAEGRIVGSILFLFASVFVPDRIVEAGSEIAADIIRNKQLAAEHLLAVRRSGSRRFQSQEAAIRHALLNLETATAVSGTVFRDASTTCQRLYARWLRAKINSAMKSRCRWLEIISSHLPAAHGQHAVAERLSELGHDWYEHRLIDDNVVSMLQITIFVMPDRKEVILGWDTADGEAFLITDEDLIAHFEGVFHRLWRSSSSN